MFLSSVFGQQKVQGLRMACESCMGLLKLHSIVAWEHDYDTVIMRVAENNFSGMGMR